MPNAWFGRSVDLSGDTALIGASGDGGVSSAAYVFVDTGSTWMQQAKLTSGDSVASDEFGIFVSLSGDTAIVNAVFDDDAGTDSGSAYIFERDALGNWSEVAKLTASDGAPGDHFGSVSTLSGDTAIITSPVDDAGSAYVFKRGGTGIWSEETKLVASDGVAGDLFGAGVSAGLSNGRAIIAAILDDGNKGSAYIFGLDDEGPITTDVVATPVPINTSGTVTANVDDSTTGGGSIASAGYSVDGGAFIPMVASDGAFDEVAEDVEASILSFAETGVHEICVRGTDAAENTGPEECAFLAVYDPDGGFVTGGGWIDSPAEACVVFCGGATGKANFGFVSKYKKNATVPTGNTEFNFSAGGLNFHSDTYDWLVINQGGTNAQYKGAGTINGDPGPGSGYKFMLWATDNDPGGDDTFRIRIWFEDGNDEVVVYDNGTGQAIGGGNIKVHAN